MRNLIISIVCLGLLVGVWTFNHKKSDAILSEYANTIETQIIRDIERKDWGSAYQKFDQLSSDWHEYRRTINFFLDTESINETDYTFAKARYYIKAKDESNAPGELNCLKEQLHFLHQNENLTLSNIF